MPWVRVPSLAPAIISFQIVLCTRNVTSISGSVGGAPSRNLPPATNFLARRLRTECFVMTMTVSVAGLGSIGLPVARGLDAGMEGLRLIMVGARDRERAVAAVQPFRSRPKIVDL